MVRAWFDLNPPEKLIFNIYFLSRNTKIRLHEALEEGNKQNPSLYEFTIWR